MDKLDLTIRNGNVATAAGTTHCDIGIFGEKSVAIADHLPAGARDIDAGGRYRVLNEERPAAIKGGIGSIALSVVAVQFGRLSASDPKRTVVA